MIGADSAHKGAAPVRFIGRVRRRCKARGSGAGGEGAEAAGLRPLECFATTVVVDRLLTKHLIKRLLERYHAEGAGAAVTPLAW